MLVRFYGLNGVLSRFLDGFTHKPYCIHIDACLCGGYVYGGADLARNAQSLGNCGNKIFGALRKALVNKCRKAAYEVYTEGISRSVKSLCDFYVGVTAVLASD